MVNYPARQRSKSQGRSTMKIIPKLLTLATAFLALALPSRSHAQTTETYTIGSSLCRVASSTWIDCYNMPTTAYGQTATAWIEMDYHANAEDFILGRSPSPLGDYITSDVQITSSIVYQGNQYPTEVTAILTGVNPATGQENGSTGKLDLKIAYTLCKVTRWATGLCSNTAGGTVMVSEPL